MKNKIEAIKNRKKKVEVKTGLNDSKLFFLTSLVPVVLIGILIPATVIEDSTIEFMNYSFFNPIWYVVYSLCLAVGFFLIWLRVFYWLSKTSGKKVFDKVMLILSGCMIVNYMFFGTGLGFISSELQYENGISFEITEYAFNILILLLLAGILYFVMRKWKTFTVMVLFTILLTLSALSGYRLWNIHEYIEEAEIMLGDVGDEIPQFTLSKEGKNVVVMILDRAMGQYIPYLFNEKPELEEQFAGFTYYSNVISFGPFTNFGVPPLFGGYEYTPVEMNKRDTEKLVDKHNEALKVLPVMFNDNNYKVTVCDPPYVNYSWTTDLSIYEEYPNVSAYITEGRFGNLEIEEYIIPKNKRNFFCFGLMKTMPLCIQMALYDGGNYHRVPSEDASKFYLGQRVESNMVAEGMNSDFMKAYEVLVNLPEMTRISNEAKGTFLVMMNNSTHEPMMLQEPEYIPADKVDNTDYYNGNMDRFIHNGVKLNMSEYEQIVHYQINMAALIQLGKWFDYMRENDVYDNTRIILVSDHGRDLHHIDALDLYYDEEEEDTIEFYYPLLMMKDFGSQEFVMSDEFMTNADVPTLAVKDLIEKPVNPFTGKEINNREKTAHEQYITRSHKWGVENNDGNTFIPSKWYAVSDDIWDTDNWRPINEEVIIPE